MSINKKNHINIKCSLLNKTMHSVKSEIFSIKKLWRKLTKFYPMTIISSYHKSEIQFFRNHIPCPKIMKLIRRNKWFNPPAHTLACTSSRKWVFVILTQVKLYALILFYYSNAGFCHVISMRDLLGSKKIHLNLEILPYSDFISPTILNLLIYDIIQSICYGI